MAIFGKKIPRKVVYAIQGGGGGGATRTSANPDLGRCYMYEQTIKQNSQFFLLNVELMDVGSGFLSINSTFDNDPFGLNQI